MSKASEVTNVNGAAAAGSSRLLVMIQKEWLELLRSFKLIWVPLVFIALGIMQPVVLYYMPIILESAGNMPDGTVIEMPMPSGGEVLAQTLGQYGTLGILVLVLVFMGTVSSERNSGSAAMILVKPVSVTSYIVSKWVSMLTLTLISLGLGYMASWYYTNLLIESMPFKDVLTSMLVYSLWIMVVLTLALLFSTLLRSGAAAAFSALGITILLTIFTGLFPKQLGWGPGALTGFSYQLALDAVADTGRMYTVIGVSAALIAVLVVLSAYLLRRSPAID